MPYKAKTSEISRITILFSWQRRYILHVYILVVFHLFYSFLKKTNL